MHVLSSSAARDMCMRMDEWWRPIPRTPTTQFYITAAAALNIPHAGAWAGWHGLMWHIRHAGEAEAIESANGVRMGRAEKWPWWDETSLRDAREGLATIGHPAAQRHPKGTGRPGSTRAPRRARPRQQKFRSDVVAAISLVVASICGTDNARQRRAGRRPWNGCCEAKPTCATDWKTR